MNINFALSYIVHHRHELLTADQDLLNAASDAISFTEWELGDIELYSSSLDDDTQ